MPLGVMQMYQLRAEPRVQVVIEIIAIITLYELDFGQSAFSCEFKYSLEINIIFSCTNIAFLNSLRKT